MRLMWKGKGKGRYIWKMEERIIPESGRIGCPKIQKL